MLAVILSGRKEKDSEFPYPLMNFHEGECLIDRTLSILREIGYDKILIVSGYKYEDYLKYVSNDVTVIKNQDYKYTSSMSSLACARDVIDDDFLLIEGDTFFEKIVVERLSSDKRKTLMVVTEESGSGDEAFVETQDGYVVKVSKDKHQICHFDGELVGLMKISLESYKKMLLLWDSCNNPYLNYEYVLIDSVPILQRPFILFPNLIWGDVDTQEDFYKLKNYTYRKLKRKENPFDEENLKSHIKNIFPKANLENVVITQIGGMSNKNFKVSVNGHDYILRVPGIGSEGMVERLYEEQNSIRVCQLNITPKIEYFDSISGIKLAEYVNDAETLNCATVQRADNMDKIVTIFKKLHNSQIRFNNDFNVFAEIRKYELLLENADGKMYLGYSDFRDEIFALEEKLNCLGVELKPCHNDLVAENFIKSIDGSIYLIDWEYSGMNDPIWDISALFLESEFSFEHQEYFLSQYFSDSIPSNVNTKIMIYQILMDVLWSIWTCIKEAKGDDFGSYGYDRYTRAIRNFEQLKKI